MTGAGELSQLDRASLAALTPEQIKRAHGQGRLRDLLDPPVTPPDRDRIAGTGQLERSDLAGMGPERIVAAARAGRLRDLGITMVPPWSSR